MSAHFIRLIGLERFHLKTEEHIITFLEGLRLVGKLC